MADRLSQLQDAVNQLAEQFCNSIGIIQQTAQLGSFQRGARTGSTPRTPEVTQEGHTALFATLITRTAKDIDYLINSLPSDKSTAEHQASSLLKLEKENQEAGRRLEQTIEEGEQLLSEIRDALHDISEALMQSQSQTEPKSHS